MGGAFGDFDAFLEGEGGQLAAFLLRTRGRGIVGWGCGIGGDGGADKIFAFFFVGVLLSQKTHGLLLASVCSTVPCKSLGEKVRAKPPQNQHELLLPITPPPMGKTTRRKLSQIEKGMIITLF